MLGRRGFFRSLVVGAVAAKVAPSIVDADPKQPVETVGAWTGYASGTYTVGSTSGGSSVVYYCNDCECWHDAIRPTHTPFGVRVMERMEKGGAS